LKRERGGDQKNWNESPRPFSGQIGKDLLRKGSLGEKRSSKTEGLYLRVPKVKGGGGGGKVTKTILKGSLKMGGGKRRAECPVVGGGGLKKPFCIYTQHNKIRGAIKKKGKEGGNKNGFSTPPHPLKKFGNCIGGNLTLGSNTRGEGKTQQKGGDGKSSALESEERGGGKKTNRQPGVRIKDETGFLVFKLKKPNSARHCQVRWGKETAEQPGKRRKEKNKNSVLWGEMERGKQRKRLGSQMFFGGSLPVGTKITGRLLVSRKRQKRKPTNG